jgi:hypothetical protein
VDIVAAAAMSGPKVPRTLMTPTGGLDSARSISAIGGDRPERRSLSSCAADAQGAAHPASVEVTTLVPGDIADLQLGDVAPPDIQLLTTTGLECNEAVLTVESAAVEKTVDSVPAGTGVPSCAALP